MTISLRIDKQADIGRFIRFMDHPDYPGKKAVILKAYPEIASGQSIEEVINYLYEKNEDQIENIFSDLSKELERDKYIIESLGIIMSSDIHKEEYEAILTLLPFSPIEEKRFYFSIYPIIFRKKDGSPLRSVSISCTAIHEISHFIFFEQLRKWENATGKVLPHPAEHYFKEALTAAIMNQDIFKNHFNYKSLMGSDNYRGNKELHKLSIQKESGAINIVSFFEEKLFRKTIPYDVTLYNIIDRFFDKQEIFAKKWRLWNEYLLSNIKDEISGEYLEPILLK